MLIFFCYSTNNQQDGIATFLLVRLTLAMPWKSSTLKNSTFCIIYVQAPTAERTHYAPLPSEILECSHFFASSPLEDAILQDIYIIENPSWYMPIIRPLLIVDLRLREAILLNLLVS